MNKKETAQLISKIRALYPDSYAKRTPAELQKMVAAWCEVFSDIDANKIFRALRDYALESEAPYPPTPGQLNKIIKDYEATQIPPEFEAELMERLKRFEESENRELLESS